MNESRSAVEPSLSATRQLLEAFPSAALAVDEAGRILIANREAARLLARSLAELEGCAIEALVAERGRGALRALLRALPVSAQGAFSRADQQLSLTLPSRREIEVQLAHGVLQCEGGTLRLISLLDVSAVRAAERDTMERLSSIIEHAAEGIFLVRVEESGAFVFEEWNAETERWTGVPRQRVFGLRPRDFLPAEEASRVEARYRACLEAGEPITYEEHLGDASGPRSFHTTLVPIRDASGRICRIMGMARDITTQVQAERARQDLEAQLRQAHKLEALGTLAGGIAHDFNNLLGVMVALTDLIDWELGDPSQVRLHLDDMRATTRRAGDLVRQILTFSRRQKLERRPLRLDVPVRDALKLLRATLPSTLQIDAEVDGDTPLVLADPTQINQVLVNLATNASHAIGARQGRLAICLRNRVVAPGAEESKLELRAGRYAQLTLRDDGPGMDAETLKHIFEPFYTTKPAGQGTGLGLAIVHGIVTEHEGQVRVASTPGAGSTFEVFFPEYPVEVSDVIELTAHLQRGRGETVLLIDDERHLCESLSKLLERLGYAPTARTDPLEALELVRKNPGRFDLVLTDLTMPGMSGIDLARALASGQDGVLPIVMMTGYTGTWTDEAVQSFGVSRLVCKPVTAPELARVLRDVLDQRKQRRNSA